MNRLHNPWPSRGPRELAAPRPRGRELRAVGELDVVEARLLMAGEHGPPLSLHHTAQVVGVLARDLDLAMWRRLGSRR